MKTPARTPSAFSLVEVLIAVTVIGILAALAVPAFKNITEGSRRNIAKDVVAGLNQATRKFSHSQWDLRSNPLPESAGDERLMLRTLQWKDPDLGGELNPKGPFMRNDWSPDTSTKKEDYRAQWTGSTWKLVEPGEVGAGLKIVFDGSDLGKPYVHPPAFKPAGSR